MSSAMREAVRLVWRQRGWSEKWWLARLIVRSWLQTPAQRRQIRGVLRRTPITFPVHFNPPDQNPERPGP